MADDDSASDSFTETSTQGWFSKIGDALKGIVFGLILFVVSFPLLIWNEGRAVKTAKSLAEGRGAVQTVPSDRVDPGNEGKLVHTTGRATTKETLADREFGVSVGAIRLKRKVEMYQWKETSQTEKRDKVGGSTETVTTYSYNREWSESLIDSSRFKQQGGHQNPRAMPLRTTQWQASQVMLGAFSLSAAQVAAIGGEEPLEPSADKPAPAGVSKPVAKQPGGYYIGEDPQAPAVGDLRVSFFKVPETDLTIVASQSGSSFQPFRAKAGGTVDLQRRGIASADELFTSAEQSNATLTWILRAVGWLMMAFGIGLVLRPLSVLASVLPFVGDLIGAGTGIVAILLSGFLSLVTIAIAWIAFRPVLGIALLAAGGGLAYGIIHLVRKVRAARIGKPSAVPA
jgi:hypothetical protein